MAVTKKKLPKKTKPVQEKGEFYTKAKFLAFCEKNGLKMLETKTKTLHTILATKAGYVMYFDYKPKDDFGYVYRQPRS